MSSDSKVVSVIAVNPDTVCCSEALLACALFSVGVRQDPHFPFEILKYEVDGVTVTRWCWHFEPRSRDGLYSTATLVELWNSPLDPPNPTDEWTMITTALRNMAKVALGIRSAIPRIVIGRGMLTAIIPSNASPERRAFLLDQVEGRIPFSTPFEFTSADTAE